MSDQAFYDTLFGLRNALVFAVREAREAQGARVDMTVRALRLEAMLRNTRIERDYWKDIVTRDDAAKRRWREKGHG